MLHIEFFDQNGVSLWQGELRRLSVHEKTVIGKSIEIYDDPEPCMIHRGAVITLLYQMIARELPMADTVPINRSHTLCASVQLPENAHSARLTEVDAPKKRGLFPWRKHPR